MAFELVDLDRQGTRMKIIFVRHGEPDYRELEERSYIGFGIDLAPLSEMGRQQVQKLSKNPLLSSAEIIVSSAVTRALETASYVVCATGLPLRVEPLLHEWQVYKTGIENFETARRLFLENKGELLPNSPIQYETATEMKSRPYRWGSWDWEINSSPTSLNPVVPSGDSSLCQWGGVCPAD